MTSERLLNMSIKFYTSPKIFKHTPNIFLATPLLIVVLFFFVFFSAVDIFFGE